MNIFISTGECSKVSDWTKQTVIMIEQPQRIALIRICNFEDEEFVGATMTCGFEFLNKEGRSILRVG